MTRTPVTAFLKLVNTTVEKKPGLVGDLCAKVVGDCEKFMECRKHEQLAMNLSSCQCMNGYVPNSLRRCRKF
jgi:hypothetical protein